MSSWPLLVDFKGFTVPIPVSAASDFFALLKNQSSGCGSAPGTVQYSIVGFTASETTTGVGADGARILGAFGNLKLAGAPVLDGTDNGSTSIFKGAPGNPVPLDCGDV